MLEAQISVTICNDQLIKWSELGVLSLTKRCVPLTNGCFSREDGLPSGECFKTCS